MASYKDYQPHIHDDFFTKEQTFKQIAPFIPKDKKVYMPFYSPYSNCNELLGKHINNEIIYEDKDFFSYKITDGLICDNPPFSIKQKILKKLFEDDTPFMLILPVSTLCYKYLRIFDNTNLQLIILNGRPTYTKCNNKGELDNSKSSPAFDSCVFCYKIGLEKDINFAS
jgi:hypothetical protein